MSKPLEKVAEAALDLDASTQKLFKPMAATRIAGLLHGPSKLGDQPQLRTLCGALILAGILLRNRRLTRAGSRMIIAHEAATFGKDMVKTNIDRKRPRSASRQEEKKPKKGHHRGKELSSFPSGHSSGALAVARAFSREYPEHGAAALGAAGVVAALQIVRCAHYPTDVAAGVALGLAAEKGSDLLWQAAGIDG